MTTKKKKHGAANPSYRLSKLHVLVADRDPRIGSLIQRVLHAFGFRNIDIATHAEGALKALKAHPYDLLITEWNMEPVDGLTLVKAVRSAKPEGFIIRDMPIIMLTARSDQTSIYTARDAGINEFVAKPFSAQTISDRIIRIVDSPRIFVDSMRYKGPCRRRRGILPPGVQERRGRSPDSKILPANQALADKLGDITAADLFDNTVIGTAQLELLKAEGEFIEWAQSDIARLEQAFRALAADNTNKAAFRELVEGAYVIKSQAGIFGYGFGTDIAALLLNYLGTWRVLTSDQLVVLRKHIDILEIIFKQKIKDSGQQLARDMIAALQQLSDKFN